MAAEEFLVEEQETEDESTEQPTEASEVTAEVTAPTVEGKPKSTLRIQNQAQGNKKIAFRKIPYNVSI